MAHDGVGTPDAMALLDLPFAFSQVPLLTSRMFLDEAKLWDYRLTLGDLQELNELRLLVPFYRAADDAIPEMVARPHPDDHSTIARYAREGMIRDHAAEDPSPWPHLRPADAHEDWWDGFFYSKWQLLGLVDALRERSNYRIVPESLSDGADLSAKIREEHLALAALSARWFPRIIGQISYRDGADRENLSAARHGIDSRSRLAAASFPAERLRPSAEHLLSRAHMYDPMREWWDLIRHSDHKGWFRTRGGALEAIWQRLAAEVLLQAHEELAETGDVQPLPDTEAAPRFWTPLQDRVSARAHTDGLERSLSRVSLNPHPRVLLVVEGETELLHVGALLEELGIGRPNQVRIDRQGTSSDWPNQLARYIAPRLGRIRGGHYDVEFGPTALVVAMDAEGRRWGTPQARDNHLRQLQSIVQAEVQAQGGSLTQNELDILVQVRTWGAHKYELANFTDDELETALIAVSPEISERSILRAAIAHARSRNLDVEVVFQRMHWPVAKLALARELLPVLLGKLYVEVDAQHETVPVIELAHHVNSLSHRLSGGGFHLETPIALEG